MNLGRLQAFGIITGDDVKVVMMSSLKENECTACMGKGTMHGGIVKCMNCGGKGHFEEGKV